MTPESSPFSQEELAAIDAQYEGFPAFGAWPEAYEHQELWQRAWDSLNAVSSSVPREALQQAQDIVLRAAAFDSGAIEGLYSTDRGLTRTVATQAAAWEQRVDEQEDDARALFAAQLAALELVLDVATGKLPDVTQAWIRRLHEVITEPQETYEVITPAGVQRQPLPHGEYKTNPNHVQLHDGSIHAYAPVEQTQAEMQRLADELNSPAFQAAGPILQAAYAHYAFVAIHPFADGNGRVARTLASTYTYRNGSVPLLIFLDQRDDYFGVLKAADDGDPGPLVTFVGDCVIAALVLITEKLQEASGPQPEESLRALRELALAQGDLTHVELDGIADDVVGHLIDAAQATLTELDVPPGVEVAVGASGGPNSSEPPPGFRPIVKPAPRFATIGVRAASPGEGHAGAAIDAFVSMEEDPSQTVCLQRPEDSIIFGLREVHPHLSMAAEERLRSLAKRCMGDLLGQVAAQSRASLERRGYRR